MSILHYWWVSVRHTATDWRLWIRLSVMVDVCGHVLSKHWRHLRQSRRIASLGSSSLPTHTSHRRFYQGRIHGMWNASPTPPAAVAGRLIRIITTFMWELDCQACKSIQLLCRRLWFWISTRDCTLGPIGIPPADLIISLPIISGSALFITQ